MARLGNLHSEKLIQTTLDAIEDRYEGLADAVLEATEWCLGSTAAEDLPHPDLEQLEVAAYASLMCRQTVVDLNLYVLPNMDPAEGIPEILSEQLSFEIFDIGGEFFMRWIIKNPERYLTGYVDQYALAESELAERIAQFDNEMGKSDLSIQYHNAKMARVGLAPVLQASDLTADHVLFMGAMLTVNNYNVIPGQTIPKLTRGIFREQWIALTKPKKGRHVDQVVAKQRTQFSTHGYGFPMAVLWKRGVKDARPHLQERRRDEIEARGIERAAEEQVKQERRGRALAERLEARAEAAETKAKREAAQREALSKKSQKDRDRWEQARAAQEAAIVAIVERNKELFPTSKLAKKKRKKERALVRAEEDRMAEIQRCETLDGHLHALPDGLQEANSAALIELLKRDARRHASTAEERLSVAEWDVLLRTQEWASSVDPDLQAIVETWLRNEFSGDNWLKHLDQRIAAERKQATQQRILEAKRESARRLATEEQAAELETQRAPGTCWSEHLRFLQTLTSEQRIERVKGSGFIGPPNGFGTLERHLHGESTDRERRDYGKERWQNIGSAFAELCSLERLAFYRVSVRMARELPGVLNPDFLILDTLGPLESQARIRPMDVKKIYLDRSEQGRTAIDNAAHHFSIKLTKAAGQLAEGMRRYGNYDPSRRQQNFADEKGGIALFVLQTRSLTGLRAQNVESACDLFCKRLEQLDSARLIEAVDCVIVILDYMDHGRAQRPIIALHRCSGSFSSTNPCTLPGWTAQHPYLDYLLSEHNVTRTINIQRILPT